MDFARMQRLSKICGWLIRFSTLNLDEYAKSRFLKWSSEKAVDVLEDYKLRSLILLKLVQS